MLDAKYCFEDIVSEYQTLVPECLPMEALEHYIGAYSNDDEMTQSYFFSNVSKETQFSGSLKDYFVSNLQDKVVHTTKGFYFFK